MKPHKHAELIKAWADGAEIQARVIGMGYAWQPLLNPRWDDKDIVEYRIKPEPKPDFISYLLKDAVMGDWGEYLTIPKGVRYDMALKLVCSGETGEPKSAEVLK